MFTFRKAGSRGDNGIEICERVWSLGLETPDGGYCDCAGNDLPVELRDPADVQARPLKYDLPT